ncbi:MAG: hypothetical protein IJ745_08190 [Bacteroidales bacterium]|nr:hypothetical protein [Bacteroidales bacterium]
MENIQTIEQYIAGNMVGKIKSKRDFPFAGLIIMAIGVLSMVWLTHVHGHDSLQALLLAVGIGGIAVGLLLLAINLSGAMQHNYYVPTGSRMVEKKVYLGTEDYAKAVAALSNCDKNALGALRSTVSSNCALRILRSRDGSIALLQAYRDDTGHIEVDTPVMCLVGTETSLIKAICK